MKTALKAIFVTAFFAGIGLIAAPEKPFIINKQNKRIQADEITADLKGVLTYKASGFSQKMKPGQYKYARIPKPKAIKTAYSKWKRKKYGDAIKDFDKCYKKYRYLGWDVYCVYYSAYALDKLGKKAEAIAMVNKLTGPPKDKTKEKRYLEAKKLLAELYIANSNFKPAEVILIELSRSSNPSVAPFANNKAGDILLKQGKRKDAILMYLRTALLFGKDNKRERPEALLKIVEILKKDRNNKYLEFEKIMNKDYPTDTKIP